MADTTSSITTTTILWAVFVAIHPPPTPSTAIFFQESTLVIPTFSTIPLVFPPLTPLLLTPLSPHGGSFVNLA